MDATYSPKFKYYYRQLSVLGNTFLIQCCALLYSLKGDNSFALTIVSLLTFFLVFGFYFYWTSHNKGLAQYCRRQYWIQAKRPWSLYSSILMIGIIAAQFFLPGYINYYIQNILYIVSFLYLISMTILLYVKSQPRKMICQQ